MHAYVLYIWLHYIQMVRLACCQVPLKNKNPNKYMGCGSPQEKGWWWGGAVDEGGREEEGGLRELLLATHR